jgi:uncharacterized membrane protein YfcA
MMSERVRRAALVGLGAGFLSGIFGVGGGILIVPALVLLLHFEQRLAHGTSLAAVLPIAASGLAALALEGKVDWPVGVLLAIGAMGGAVIGTHILHVLPQRVLGLIFAALLIATAIRLLTDHSSADGRASLTVGAAIGLVLVGLATGILAGLLGVGGGIVMVPAMIVLYGIPSAVAKGTSLFVILPTSIMGTWRNRRKRNVDLRVAAAVGLGGVVSSFPAALIAARMDESLSNVLVALLLLFVAARMLWTEWRNRREEPAAATPVADS